ncbi:MAG: extracellular solute-binding protein [Verrucomicrobia bacterium]|nr:extracellular solute-binding protein [Verrucomicrobiota bacterium]MCH8513232.1 extracellular solute-binding protein [Kiritimatiellia bacterium]
MKPCRYETFFHVFIVPVFFLGVCCLWGCGRNDGGASDASSRSDPFRILMVADPVAMAFERELPRLEEALGRRIQLETVGYNDGRRLALLNALDEVSRYDLIAFDIVWLGEFVNKGILSDLSDAFPEAQLDAFLSEPLRGSRIGGRLYGLPIQPHGEHLWVRKDLLADHGLDFPKTTDAVLEVAKILHDPAAGRYGIAWNAQRGQPLGQTMAHFFAAFGQPLLDEAGMPAFHTERGLKAAEYALALKEYSPPDILNMAWDLRTSRFAAGGVAMTYGWGARAHMAEDNSASRVRGLVTYGPAPHAPDASPVTPLGVWSLGVPAHARSRRHSVQMLSRILQPDVQRWLVEAGNGAPPLIDLVADLEIQQKHPVLETVQALDQAGHFDMEMRPRIPQWADLCEILGTEFHEMLAGRASPEEALQRADAAARKLLAAEVP